MRFQPAMVKGNRWDGFQLHSSLFVVLMTGLTQVASLAASFILFGAVSKDMGVEGSLHQIMGMATECAVAIDDNQV